MREFGSEFPITATPDFFFKKLVGQFKSHRFLETGRQGLRLIARELYSSNSLAILPAYCCKTMVNPFIEEKWNVAYYPILSNLDGDADVINSLVEKAPDNSVLLLMNYFGFSNVNGIIAKLNNREKVKIIYDITHCVFDIDNEYIEGVDYYVCSIRKWVGLNSGALVCANSDFKNDIILNVESEFVNIRKKAMEDNLRYQTTGDIDEKRTFKAALKEAALRIDSIPREMDRASVIMLEGLNCNYLLWKRRFNLNHLYNIIRGNKKITFLPGMEEIMNSGHCFFMLPILLEERDYYQKQLSDRGLYAQILWPLMDEARQSSSIAATMESKMLAIPIDQRFSYNDIEDIGRIINSTIV